MNNFNTILAAIANLQVKRGDAVKLVLTFTDPNTLDIDGNPQPYPLNKYDSITVGCKRWPSDEVPLWTLASGYTGDQDQQLIVDLTATQTGLLAGKYYYDIEGFIGSAIETICEGEYIINQDVQR